MDANQVYWIFKKADICVYSHGLSIGEEGCIHLVEMTVSKHLMSFTRVYNNILGFTGRLSSLIRLPADK